MIDVIHPAESPRTLDRLAQFGRWSIVVVAMTLVPATAFVGQSIGQWLRTKEPSKWALGLVTSANQEPTETPVKVVNPPLEAGFCPLVHAPPMEESAAMYSGPVRGVVVQAPPAERDVLATGSPNIGLGGRMAVPPPEDAPASVQGGEDNRFADLEQRLRQLGAVHYVLEADTQRGAGYHFRCRMESPSVARRPPEFEAAGETPLEAIQQVVRQAENWSGSLRR